MLILSELVSKELNQYVSTRCIWTYLRKHWDTGKIVNNKQY